MGRSIKAMCVAFADRWALPLSFLLSFAIFAIAQQPSSKNNVSGFYMPDDRYLSGTHLSMKCFGEGMQYNNTISMLKPAGGLVRSTYASGSCRYSQGFRFIESFYTNFIFDMAPGNSDYENQSGVINGQRENIDGLALVISDSPEFAFQGAPGGYLGIEFPKSSSNQSTSNYSVLAVEFDVFPNPEFGDPLYDHVGIDLNGMNSSHTAMAGFYGVNQSNNQPIFVPMKLSGVGKISAIVNYVGGDQPYLSVTLLPDSFDVYDQNLSTPLINASLDPSKVAFLQSGSDIYVGMSASHGSDRLSHLALAYASDWLFRINDISDIPLRQGSTLHPAAKLGWVVTLSVLIPVSVTAMLVLGGVLYLRQSRKRLHKEFENILQDYRPRKFSLKDLKLATLGFSEDRALGRGGYGTVYKGILCENTVVAVKKFSAKHQTDRDAASSSFVQELKVIGRLRHVNLVRLLGWCHEKEELMLVYEFMPNRSLDHYLFSKGQSPSEILSWDRRFQILKGVARALAYLHDEWRQLVVHRDVKVSNVLLDLEFNGRLGDFGLARLYDHKDAWNPKTTNVAGTCGYIAPEIFLNPKFTENSKGNFTEKSDVYAFGMVALQIVSGRKIYDPTLEAEDQELLEWIHFMLNCGRIMDVVDGRLGETFESKQALDVLQIGLCCTNSDPNPRPRMRQILEMLEGEASIPPLQVQSSPPEAIFLPISGVDDDDLEETPLRHAEFEISTTFSRVATASLVR